MIIAMTLLIVPVYFPMWGGMLCPPREGVVEEVCTYATFCCLRVNHCCTQWCARTRRALVTYAWLLLQRQANKLASSKAGRKQCAQSGCVMLVCTSLQSLFAHCNLKHCYP